MWILSLRSGEGLVYSFFGQMGRFSIHTKLTYSYELSVHAILEQIGGPKSHLILSGLLIGTNKRPIAWGAWITLICFQISVKKQFHIYAMRYIIYWLATESRERTGHRLQRQGLIRLHFSLNYHLNGLHAKMAVMWVAGVSIITQLCSDPAA